MLAATQDTRTHSQSPSRPSLTEKISALGSKLSRTLTGGESTVHGEEDRDSVASLDVQKDRSRSRGRDLLQSTGRGGFGNIRQPSASRDRPADGPDDFSVTRGREPNPLTNPNVMYSTGRGGAGNLRSPSRDASKGPDAREREVIKEYAQHHGEIPASTGRGGLGNINRSRSRDPNLGANLVSSGRGGAGNIHANEGGYNANAADESERKRHEGLHADGFHSTGRGGFANITGSHEPAVERPVVVPNPAAYHSSGRGGAGNIHTGA